MVSTKAANGKRCPHCKTVQPHSEFFNSKHPETPKKCCSKCSLKSASKYAKEKRKTSKAANGQRCAMCKTIRPHSDFYNSKHPETPKKCCAECLLKIRKKATKKTPLGKGQWAKMMSTKGANERQCQQCNRVRPDSEFRNPKKPNTLMNTCSECLLKKSKREETLMDKNQCTRCYEVRPPDEFISEKDPEKRYRTCINCRLKGRQNDKVMDKDQCTRCYEVRPPDEFISEKDPGKRYGACINCRLKRRQSDKVGQLSRSKARALEDLERLQNPSTEMLCVCCNKRHPVEAFDNTKKPGEPFQHCIHCRLKVREYWSKADYVRCPLENCVSHTTKFLYKQNNLKRHMKYHGNDLFKKWEAQGGLRSMVSLPNEGCGFLEEEMDDENNALNDHEATQDPLLSTDEKIASSEKDLSGEDDALDRLLAETLWLRNQQYMELYPGFHFSKTDTDRLDGVHRLCRGPRPPVDFCIESPCPHNADITLSSAKLKTQDESSKLFKLPSRCYRCASSYEICQQLERQGLLAASDASKGCQEIDCAFDRWGEATLCIKHLALVDVRKSMEHYGGRDSVNLNEYTIRERMRLQRGNCPTEWIATKEMLAAEIQDLNNLLFIDMEFSFKRSKVYSIALVNGKGEIVCHILVDYSFTSAADHGPGLKLHPYFQRIDKYYRQKVHNTPRHRFTAQLSPVEALEELRRWIHPGTKLHCCGRFDVDLRMLRKWADIHDSSDFLPPNGSSPAGVPLLRKVLPGLPTYGLDFVFRALFPNDPLKGQNHFADADAKMCYMVIKYCLEAFQVEPDFPKVGKIQVTLVQTWNRNSAAKSTPKRKIDAVDSEDDEGTTAPTTPARRTRSMKLVDNREGEEDTAPTATGRRTRSRKVVDNGEDEGDTASKAPARRTRSRKVIVDEDDE